METTEKKEAAAVPLSVVNAMLDRAIDQLKARSDAALCRALEVHAPVISKIRSGRLSIGSNMLIRLHETLGWSIQDMKKELGLPSLSR